MVGVSTTFGVSLTLSTCQNCGNHVSDQFSRVYGDNQNRVHRCPDCDSYRRLTRGSAAGKALEIPDPETANGHQGGESDV
ncbi:DUF7563 family protein [Natronolimnobius baerhuensis]|uniref:Small CPxCG-related zinc finger protein n=1 Tax=Natronolimnobius baerhuensis TaxID=253108 RepID=A0A202E9R8_9EURY|nr:hypothetical protein [Natronolimnobius baerhuensis]OVE84730.1 hypothetical protein B2G88_10120 [Natronolimnobius baerhuensis]